MFLKNTPVQVQPLVETSSNYRFLVRGVAKRAIYVEIHVKRGLSFDILLHAAIRAAMIAKRHNWKRIFITRETMWYSGLQIYCNASEAKTWLENFSVFQYYKHPERDFSCWDDPINIDYSILISL